MMTPPTITLVDDRSWEEIFASAAAGNAVDQEQMCRITLNGSPDLNAAPEVQLWIAFQWANMALINGNLSVRSLRISILVVMANRSLADAPERARSFATDALAQIYELMAEGDADMTAFLPRFLQAVTDDFGSVGRKQIIEAASELAGVRAAAGAIVCGAGTAADAATVH